jgi:two-component system sensor histidine kinase QseC
VNALRGPGTTLRRRLMRLVLLATPALWGLSMLLSFLIAHQEIDELFRRRAGAGRAADGRRAAGRGSGRGRRRLGPPRVSPPRDPRRRVRGQGPAGGGLGPHRNRLPVAGRGASLLPHRPGLRGFVDLELRRRDWRAFYLPTEGQGQVAVAQRVDERRELVRNLAIGPLVPWLLALPLLLLALALGLERVLRPLRRLSAELDGRAADDLRPLDARGLPADLCPLVAATNAQFARVATLLERERRFTSDAAHELRTPLAVLQAQWDAALLDADGAPLPEPLRKLGEGLARMSRLVTQLLLLSRVEHRESAAPRRPVDWSALVAEAFTDALPLAERRGVELACEDRVPGGERFPLRGDAPLLAALLRNLLDNALRHSPRGGQVTLRFGADRLEVLDDGPGVAPEQLGRLGDRFYRPPGETEPGSGLGLSIVRRIADWHGLAVDWGPREDAPASASGCAAPARRPRPRPRPARRSRPLEAPASPCRAAGPPCFLQCLRERHPQRRPALPFQRVRRHAGARGPGGARPGQLASSCGR